MKAGAASIATGRYANKEDLVRGLGAGAQGKMRAALGLIERAEAKYPGVSSWLAEMGALHQPAVIERLAARAAGLKRKGL
ncbi:hypothetical protein CCC_02279 [Paramagnetospirillum magnetotacticum MS-1]|uniref:Uncharacterized protein n=1 Tax=Paramagnetospirillum magnetotacticum MS-1 TaxID=272627 RepID=A0A0C2YGD1_PARME|nr:hypothetical protein CCC_02279 [Paramagnetospirillum magnetotacticum MS-1]